MNSDSCDKSAGPTAGSEHDYIDHIPVIMEDKTIQPGSTKVRNLCIKPITVTVK